MSTPARAAGNGGNPPGPSPARTAPSVGGLGQYLRDVWAELKKAQWPSRPELIRLTQVVLGVIGIVALYCGLLDAVLTWVTSSLLGFGRR